MNHVECSYRQKKALLRVLLFKDMHLHAQNKANNQGIYTFSNSVTLFRTNLKKKKTDLALVFKN